MYPSYWGFKNYKHDLEEKIEYHLANPSPLKFSDDVEQEKEKVLSKNLNDDECFRVIEVSKTFTGLFKSAVTALLNVSFMGKVGECIGLLGHNGAGKSTLLNILTGKIDPSSGEIYIFGKNIENDLDELKEEIGYCHQQNLLWDQLTVVEHLRIYAVLRNVPILQVSTQIESILDEIHLQDARNKYVSQLSGGMKRRLCCGIALVGNPRILFLDEPTAGLDPLSKRHVSF